MTERKPIPGFPGYTVTGSGEIYSGVSTRPIKPFTTTDGYLRARLSVAGRNKNILVHRAVALSWLGCPPSDTHEVNHIDGVKVHNNLSNLEWVTRSENLKHAARMGLRNLERGDTHHSTLMTDALCAEAIEMLRSGELVKDVSASFGIHRTTLLQIRRRQGIQTGRGNYQEAK